MIKRLTYLARNCPRHSPLLVSVLNNIITPKVSQSISAFMFTHPSNVARGSQSGVDSTRRGHPINAHTVKGRREFTQPQTTEASALSSPLPSTAPGPYLPSIAPGPYLPSTAPGPYLPSTAPGPYLPSTAPGPYLPSHKLSISPPCGAVFTGGIPNLAVMWCWVHW